MKNLIAKIVWTATAALLLAGCASMPKPPADEPDFAWPEEAPAPADGGIYHTGRDITLFDNATARHIGDTVTIHLVESTAAQKSSSTSTAKASKATMAAPIVIGNPVSIHGNSVLSGSLGNDSSFAGSGDSKQSNSLTGDITVTVIKRAPNGNLLVRGNKWIGINQGKEFVRLQGVIRPYDIAPDNSVPSSKVADAKIAYGAKGALNDANRPGLLARFFSSFLF
jgi:flagellar L-ring protein FlgH